MQAACWLLTYISNSFSNRSALNESALVWAYARPGRSAPTPLVFSALGFHPHRRISVHPGAPGLCPFAALLRYGFVLRWVKFTKQ